MIERKFVAENVKEFQIQEFISSTLKNVGHSHTKLVRTPLGEKIIIFASKPGLVVGRKGDNIKKLTATLKKKFNLENPQIEISEVETPNLDAQIVAERIASTIERFGIQKFKAVGHKTMKEVIDAGALGIEIVMSGKVPSSRAKSWRFYQGYLKKCGELATSGVRKAYAYAQLKPGIVGIKVRIMPPELKLPDDIELAKDVPPVEPAKESPKEEKKETPKRSRKKKAEEKTAEEKKEKTETENKESGEAK